jgi:hypothetical protein
MLYRGHTHLPAMFCKHWRRWTEVFHRSKAIRARLHLDDKLPTHSVVMLHSTHLVLTICVVHWEFTSTRDHDPCRRLCTLAPTTTEHGWRLQAQLIITNSNYSTACIPAGRTRRHGMARQAHHAVLVLVALACAAGAAAQGGELHFTFLSVQVSVETGSGSWSLAACGPIVAASASAVAVAAFPVTNPANSTFKGQQSRPSDD